MCFRLLIRTRSSELIKNSICQTFGRIFLLFRLKTAEFEKIDAAAYKRFLSKQSENVLITVLIVQTKSSQFAKRLNVTNFQTSDGSLRNWKER